MEDLSDFTADKARQTAENFKKDCPTHLLKAIKTAASMGFYNTVVQNASYSALRKLECMGYQVERFDCSANVSWK